MMIGSPPMSNSETVKDAVQVSRATLLERIKVYFIANSQESDILPPGRFCRNPAFWDDVPDDLLVLVLKLEDGQLLHKSELCSIRSEEMLLRSLRLNDLVVLRRSIVWGALAVYHAGADLSDLGIIVSAFGRALRAKWQMTKKTED